MKQALLILHLLGVAALLLLATSATGEERMRLSSPLLACGSIQLYEEMKANQSLVGCGFVEAGTEVWGAGTANGYVNFSIELPDEMDAPATFFAPAHKVNAAQADGRAFATPDPQTPRQIKTYNSQRQTNRGNVPGCVRRNEFDEFIALNNAGRRDLANELDCVVIPAGTEVIVLRDVGYYKQIVWERNGLAIKLWTRSESFHDALDWALEKCGPITSRDPECRERVYEEYVHE